MPLVPVTPTTFMWAVGSPWNRMASSESASRALSTRMTGTGQLVITFSETIALAPRRMASSMNAFPSALLPGTATKIVPVVTVRESQVIPRISASRKFTRSAGNDSRRSLSLTPIFPPSFRRGY